ncbi:MAG TPA: NOB1 family endonuclease [Archaeoglobus profundus]|nr:NOB1 family endonuclease [Archaeoglobus profundus]
MKVYIIDSSVIFLRKAYYNERMITVPEVIDEIKDEHSKLYLSLLNIKVEEPSRDSIEKVIKIAKKTGDIHKLSNTDIKLLAKTLDEMKKGNEAVLVTDDYSIQNVAKLLGIKIENIIQPKISKVFKWIKVCKGCGRKVNEEVCPICGSEVVLRRVKYEGRRSN